MKKVSLLLLVAMFAFGCASSATSGSSTGSSLGASLGDSRSATHYRLLSDPLPIREIDWSNPPNSLHIKGQITTRGFQPLSQVEGRGGLCAEGKDFVTLSDGEFHAAADGATPTGYYIYGCKGMTGGFKPATREILGQ